MRQLSTTSYRLSLIQLHLAVFLAGGVGVFAKFIALSPTIITCGRTVFGSLALAAAASLMKLSLRPHNLKGLFMLALSGAILAVHWFSFFLSVQVSTVAIGLIAFSTFPLFVTFLEPVVFGERLRWHDVAAAFGVAVGLILVTPHWDAGNDLTQGLLWGVLSAFSYALLSLLSRSYVRIYHAVSVAFYQQAFAALCTLPLALRWQGIVTGRDVVFLLALGVIFTALAQGLAIASLRCLRAQTASIAYGLEPFYGILLASLLLDERPAARTIASGLLICCSVLWVSIKHGNSAIAGSQPDNVMRPVRDA